MALEALRFSLSSLVSVCLSVSQAGLGNNPYACKKWKDILDRKGGNRIEIVKNQFVAIAGKMKVS